MNPTTSLNAETLLRFASTLEGEEIPTAGGRATFTLHALPTGIEITPRSTGTSRFIARHMVQRVCDEYQRSRSRRPGDYQKITFDASYILAVILRHLR
jgi:hypothetical protein